VIAGSAPAFAWLMTSPNPANLLHEIRVVSSMSIAVQNTPTIDAESVAAEVLAGLSQNPKQIAPKYFYDQKGSALFDAITQLDEYYLLRVEQQIFRTYREAMCAAIGKGVTLIEPGAGSCEKVKWLLPELEPAAYVPMDISADHLRISVQALNDAYPQLHVIPQAGDHTAGMHIETDITRAAPVFFYPGSSIGNFEPDAAVEFLHAMRAEMDGAAGGLLIGVDTKKEAAILHAAYNDAAGITADFNVNVLAHLNHLLDGDFDADKFVHHALYNDKSGRIEMYLRCVETHSAQLAGQRVEFAEDELIHTENSYKYHPAEFIALAERAGFVHRELWQDEQGWFAVMYFEPA
jgi:dimethylhistidine N-methyltransferase